MNDPGPPQSPAPATDAVATLLREAGLRPDVDALRRQRVLRNVQAAWQGGLRRQRRRRWLAVAAGVVLAGVVAVLLRNALTPSPGPVDDVAVVVAVQGKAWVESHGQRLALSPGHRLRAGDVLRTAAGAHVALSVAALQSLRLDAATALRLESADRFALQRGALYLDSGDRPGGVLVQTPLLRASDVGTRFQVRHTARGSTVAVRDGAVRVDQATTVAGGQRLRRQPDGTEQVDALPAQAADWDWARRAAPTLAAEGRPLREVLAWYAHEAGLTLLIAPDAALSARLDAPLQGDLDGLDADELLDVVKAAGGLTLRIDRGAGVLHVER